MVNGTSGVVALGPVTKESKPKKKMLIGEVSPINIFFFFFDISAQERGEGFKLVTFASLGVVPTD
jgi:hypothetical protein